MTWDQWILAGAGAFACVGLASLVVVSGLGALRRRRPTKSGAPSLVGGGAPDAASLLLEAFHAVRREGEAKGARGLADEMTAAEAEAARAAMGRVFAPKS